MPEGHSVFIHARDHQKLLAGKKIAVTSPQGRFIDGAKIVDGKRLRRVYAHGKHLFYDFGPRAILHVHLGRLGRFREHSVSQGVVAPDPRSACRVRLHAKDIAVDLSGPTACEVLDQPHVDGIRARLGPDLLDPHADRNAVWQIVKRRATPIGALLMDQSVVSGIGNIFRAEILYLCKIHPSTPARDLTRAQFDRLWKQSVKLLQVGVAVGLIVTIPLKSITKPVKKLRRDERFNVYRRKHCRGCGAEVKSVHLAGRPCFYCPKEQVLKNALPKKM